MKTCQVCLQPQPDVAETCSECGEASFGETVSPVQPVARSVPPVSAAAVDAAFKDDGPRDESAGRRTGKGR